MSNSKDISNIILAKAIANFMFREVIEDAHAKYNISQEDVREMCRESVDRAAVLLQVMNDPEMKQAMKLYAYSTQEWDAPNPANMEKYIQVLSQLKE